MSGPPRPNRGWASPEKKDSVRGTLWIVATPIGNLGDLSPRAAELLASVDVIACEDTRRTGLLLQHLGLKKPMRSLHEHNERARTTEMLELLAAGRSVAVVSDAGTPLLSDPGFVVTREAVRAGFNVSTAPGPSAALAALVVSGLPPYPFAVLGFPPPRSGKRRTFFGRFAELDATLVFFESPHRILASLDDAITVLGDRPAAVARELTKLHEEVLRGTLSELRAMLGARPAIKGEIVVVIGAP
ncbi:MAG TPA: 16S rRNA (cytidine(1402)-2'-O)-methyltransferase [Thermoanaerobaculia bacterium]|nr:16S rRNA (cytidine(1402)-2'-O)-methyltransferase [Thermoanaerobaculia bacterium]